MASFWDRVRSTLKREKRDLDEAVEEFTERANRSLDKRERAMVATPEEKLEIEQERGRELDEDFEAVRRRIEGTGRSDS